MICDKPEKAQVLLGNVESQETPGLRRILLMDSFDAQLVEVGEKCGVQVQALKDIEVNKQTSAQTTTATTTARATECRMAHGKHTPL